MTQKTDTKFAEVFHAAGLRVQENDIETTFDGGRVVLGVNVTPGSKLYEDEKLSGLTVLLNFRADDPMRAWPSTRVEKEAWEYQVVISRRAVAKA